MVQSETINMEALQKKLAEDLSRERVLNLQVLTYIADQYGFAENEFRRFVDEKVPELEDYELDLTFSPLFTPSLEDRAPYAPLLKSDTLSRNEVRALIAQLAERNIYAHLLTSTGENVPMVLQSVTIERFVDRLFLDKPIDLSLYEAIEATVPPGTDQSFLKVIGRESVWREPWRRETLMAFLRLYQQQKNFAVEKVMHLTDFIRTYRPNRFEDLERQLESLIQSYEQDLENVRGRRFHDPQLKEIYEADNYKGVSVHEEDDEHVISAYQKMIVMAQQLQNDYRALKELMPEAITRIQEQEKQLA